jgi:hypothetical protein
MDDEAEDPGNRNESGLARRADGTFQPGVSGNRAGRPRMDPEVRRMLEAKTRDAVQKLIDCLEAERAVVRGFGESAEVEMVPDYDLQLKAANAILDRAYGKPSQVVTGEDGGPIAVDTSSALLEALQRMAAAKGRP